MGLASSTHALPAKALWRDPRMLIYSRTMSYILDRLAEGAWWLSIVFKTFSNFLHRYHFKYWNRFRTIERNQK